MAKDQLNWREKGVVLFAILLVVLAALTIVPGWTVIGCLLSRDDAPAWVQAVGSIAAILGAAYGVHFQMQSSQRQADEQDRRLKVRKYHIILNLLGRGAGAVSSISEHLTTGDAADFGEFAREVRSFRATLSGLPPFELPDAELAYRLALVDQTSRTSAEALEYLHHIEDGRIQTSPAPMTNSRKGSLELLRRLGNWIDEAAKHCQARIAMHATQHDVDELKSAEHHKELLKRIAAERGKRAGEEPRPE